MPDARGERLLAQTLELVNIASPSRGEEALLAHLRELVPDGYTLLDGGDGVLFYAPAGIEAPSIVLAGHVDTVPAQSNFPGSADADGVTGLGSTDMKGALAVMLDLAAGLPPKARPGLLFFAREEIPITESALLPLLERSDAARAADLVVVMEPTDNALELGCLGNLNATVRFAGESAHSARPWHGTNAAHEAILGLQAAAKFETRDVEVGGLLYREVMNVTMMSGGSAQNVLPDEIACHLNFRYAPGRTPEDALQELRDILDGSSARIEVLGNAPPGPVPVDNPLVQRLKEVGDLEERPKQAWTPVAEFGMFGIDAVNMGPGDPALAHRADERVSRDALVRSAEVLERFLLGVAGEGSE